MNFFRHDQRKIEGKSGHLSKFEVIATNSTRISGKNKCIGISLVMFQPIGIRNFYIQCYHLLEIMEN
jgi:hypothetical protein